MKLHFDILYVVLTEYALLMRLLIWVQLRLQLQYAPAFYAYQCTHFPPPGEIKRAYLAEQHAVLVAKNFPTVVSQGWNAKLGTWKPNAGMKMFILSLGRKNGAMEMMCCTCTGCCPRNIKGKSFSMFMDKSKKAWAAKS